MIDWSKFANFSEAEFVCRCGCGRADMDSDFMQFLQMLRTSCGFPLHVTSGFRCPDHNARVSKTGRTGPHTTGKAADIAIAGPQVHSLLTTAIPWVRGIGLKQHGPHAKRIVHLDTTTGEMRPRVWTYR